MMRRISNLRDIRAPSMGCVLGPVRILDVDPHISEYVPPNEPHKIKKYTRGLAQCTNAAVRFTAWAVEMPSKSGTGQTFHQELLSLVGCVVDIRSARIKVAHKDYQDFGRWCVTFDFSRGAVVLAVADVVAIPQTLLDPDADHHAPPPPPHVLPAPPIQHPYVAPNAMLPLHHMQVAPNAVLPLQQIHVAPNAMVPPLHHMQVAPTAGIPLQQTSAIMSPLQQMQMAPTAGLPLQQVHVAPNAMLPPPPNAVQQMHATPLQSVVPQSTHVEVYTNAQQPVPLAHAPSPNFQQLFQNFFAAMLAGGLPSPPPVVHGSPVSITPERSVSSSSQIERREKRGLEGAQCCDGQVVCPRTGHHHQPSVSVPSVVSAEVPSVVTAEVRVEVPSSITHVNVPFNLEVPTLDALDHETITIDQRKQKNEHTTYPIDSTYSKTSANNKKDTHPFSLSFFIFFWFIYCFLFFSELGWVSSFFKLFSVLFFLHTCWLFFHLP